MNGHKLNREDGQVVSRASLKLGEILLNEKLITQSDLENALDQQSKKRRPSRRDTGKTGSYADG